MLMIKYGIKQCPFAMSSTYVGRSDRIAIFNFLHSSEIQAI